MSFKLSNSKLHDWETMCPIEFKAKHITKDYPEFVPSEQMNWGNWFETLVIGGGINGAFRIAPGSKMDNSVYKSRVEKQAADCRAYLKLLEGKTASYQEYITVKLKSNDGEQEMDIEGTLDIRRIVSALQVIIDLKLTGDTENEFGKFAWGAPEKMDLSQIIQYYLLVLLKYGSAPEAHYWVFDNGKEMKQKLIKCTISDYAIEQHIDRLFKAWDEITMAIAMDDFEPKNTWENCSKCKSPCKFKRVMPEYYLIEL